MPNLTTTALCIYMAGPMHVHNVSDVSACSQQMFAGKIEDYHRDMEIRLSNNCTLLSTLNWQLFFHENFWSPQIPSTAHITIDNLYRDAWHNLHSVLVRVQYIPHTLLIDVTFLHALELHIATLRSEFNMNNS